MEYLQYWQAVKRRWPVMLASILIICGGVVLHHLYLKSTGRVQSQYEATASILLDPDFVIPAENFAKLARVTDVCDPVFLVVNGLMEPDEANPDIWLSNGKTRNDWFFRQYKSEPGRYSQVLQSNTLKRQEFYEGIRGEAVTAVGQKSSYVYVTALAPANWQAVEIANNIAVGMQIAALETRKDLAAYDQTYTITGLGKAEENLDKARKNLQAFKEQHQDLMVPMNFAQAMAVVSQLEREVDDAETQAGEYMRRVRALKDTIGRRSKDPKFDANTAPSSAVIDRLQGQMAAQEVELMNLRLKYTDEHPKVRETRQIIQNIKDRINAEVNKAYNLADAPASLEYQFVVGDISRYEAERIAAGTRKQAAQSLLRKAKTQLAGIPSVEAQLGKLEMEYNKAATFYDELARKQAQAVFRYDVASEQRDDPAKLGKVFATSYATETPASNLMKLRLKLPIAFIIALIVGLGLCLLLDASDTSIRDVDQVEDRYQLPVLGVVPMLREAGVKGGSTLVLRDSAETPYAESYRIMRANFVALAHQSGAHSVVITSTLPGEGKTTTAANFASSLAESHKRVVLIDADMRNPSLHRAFEVDKEPGLSNYLAGTASVEDIIFPTSIENLVLISAGTIPDNPARLLTGPRMRELLDRLRQEADYVVIDTPPAVAFSDATELGAIVDSMIVVVGAGSKLESAHFRARTQLANVQAVVVGTVLNRVQPDHVDSYRYSARYYPKLNGSGKLPKKGAEQAALPDGKA